MLRQSNRRVISLLLSIGIMITFACNLITTPSAQLPTAQPTIEKIADTPTLAPPPTKHPTLRPPIPQLLPTHTEMPSFATAAESASGSSLDACTLVYRDELRALFPKPPQPSSESREEYGYIVSKCIYNGDDWVLTISMAASPDFIDSLAEEMQTIRTYPLFERFEAHGAEIYQVGTVNEGGPGEVFGGIILKDNTAVEIVGSGKSYVYEPERVTQLLSTIAHRLPPETVVFNACDLIRPEEVEMRFPNPPSPEPELLRYKGYSVVSCYYRDDTMDLTLNIKEEPGSIPEFMQQLDDLMKQVPFIIHYAAFGTDIYQWGGPNIDTSNNEEVFTAILIKGSNILQIESKGVSYQYDENREIEWMKIIANRLP